MDKKKKETIDEIFSALERIEASVLKAKFSMHGLYEPFLLLWTLKKASDMTRGVFGRDRVFTRIEDAIKGDRINLSQGDIETTLSIIETSSSLPDNTLNDFFRSSSYAFSRLSLLNGTHDEKIPFHMLDTENDKGDIFEYVILRSVSPIAYTNPTVAAIAEKILSVKDGEIFTDFMSGTGLSTEIITKDAENAIIHLYDNSPYSFAFSALYLFLCGRKGDVCYMDSLSSENLFSGEKSDKIFLSPERGRTLTPVKWRDLSLNELSLLSSIKAVNLLKESGKAVLGVTSNFAFGTKFSAEDVRKYLVENNYISSLILLPKMYSDTSIPPLLVVISKSTDHDILMMDLTEKEKDEKWFYSKKNVEGLSISEDAILETARIERERDEVKGISRIVSKDEIRKNSYNLLPTLYIEKERRNYRKVEEIDEEINKVVEEIKTLLSF